ncbi:MAG: hypothetical protein ABR585_14235 [Gemmatimonadaceae bacterium]
MDNKVSMLENPALIGLGALAGVSIIGGGAALALASARKPKRHKKSKSKKHRVGSAKQYARRGGKKVYKTKTGQPYILLASGKARFVKKRGYS